MEGSKSSGEILPNSLHSKPKEKENTDSDPIHLEKLGFTSRVLHADIHSEVGQGAIHQGIQPSVTYGYDDVCDLIDVFQNRKKGFTYSRSGSPTIAALEKKITLLEGGRSSIVFTTGLAAITTVFLSLLKQGDHTVVSRYLFGNTHSFFKTLIRLGFKVDFVDVCQADAVAQSLRPETKFFFAETIANPSTQIPEWGGIIQTLKNHEKKGKKIVTIIDNTLTTPYLFCPKDLGFSFSVNSLTKYMAGQGNVLAGSLTDLGNWQGLDDENILLNYKETDPQDCQMMQIRKKGMRDLGPTLSPYSAHAVSIGLETLSLRMDKHLVNAQAVAEFLESHPRIAKVFYPGLPSHPQHGEVKKWYRGYGGILSFILKDGKADDSFAMIRFMNSLKIFIKSTHLGDTRSLAIPVAPTIFYEMGVKEREEMGIADSQVRLSVGIEDLDDILGDLSQALDRF